MNSGKIHRGIIFSYGCIIVTYSLFTILVEIADHTKLSSVVRIIDWFIYFFAITTISLFVTPINLIIGYGLLRRRYWSRYGVLATMATLPINQLLQYMMWGRSSFHMSSVFATLAIAGATVVYFSSSNIKLLLDGQHMFRVKSWSALLIAVIMLAVFSPLIVSSVIKIRAMREFNEPFFVSKPQIVTLQRPDETALSMKYQKTRLLDTSLLIPKGFAIRRLWKVDDKSNNWKCGLSDTTGLKRGYIMYGNKFPYDELPLNREMIEQSGLINMFNNMFDYELYYKFNKDNPSPED